MRTVLLVTDLEGVAGVDSADALFACSPAYGSACDLLTAEVTAAIEGFRQAGFDRIRVTDSHHNELRTPNLLAERLPAGVELAHRDDDAYAQDLFDGVAAVACLGMHAAAGSPGFAAHTVAVHCAWAVAGRRLSESDIVLGLAAAQRIPTVFVAGDNVLEASLGGRVPYVVTKTATSATTARSSPAAEVRARLRAAAAGPPVLSPALPDVAWQIRFKSRWQAALAAAKARPVGDLAVELDGAGPRERYARGLSLMQLTEPPLGRAIRAFAPAALREDAVASLLRGFDRAPPAPAGPAAHRALAAFLRLTGGGDPWELPDRALILHMLEGHAPAPFAAAGLGAVLGAAVARLSEIPDEFPDGLDTYTAMRRVDAAYVRAARGLPPGRLANLVPYIRSVAREHPLPAWLMWQMATQIGACPAFPFPRRPLRPHSRLHDLYWLTHEVVLATRFLRKPFVATGWETEIEELFLATPWVAAGRRVDLAAEIALCLQLAGEEDSREHRDLLGLLLEHQVEDGAVIDPSLPDSGEARERDAHSTGVALLALARCA